MKTRTKHPLKARSKKSPHKAAEPNASPLTERACEVLRFCFFPDTPPDFRIKYEEELGTLCRIAASKGWGDFFEAIALVARRESNLRANDYRMTVSEQIRWRLPLWEDCGPALVKQRWSQIVEMGYSVGIKSFEKMHREARAKVLASNPPKTSKRRKHL